jgi:anti-sigma regulatory factor (Ser/Thr protein kinase)
MATESGIRSRRGIEKQGRDGLRMRLGSGPEAAAEARRAIGRFRTDLDPPLMETLRLLVTELVTNSVRHTASDSLTLKVAIGKSAVLTEVSDTGPGFDEERFEESASEDTGWGLFLVRRLANRWGVSDEGESKRVWFELRRA